MEKGQKQNAALGSLLVLPFYHPSTVILVDDNETFLYDLALQIDDGLAFKLFTSPLDALQYINSTSNNYKLDVEHTVNTLPYSDVARLNDRLDESNHYMANTVVIVDYTMPVMDGLTFSRNIKQADIKRIVLTATMEQGEAIQAFNTGLIDKYISKHESNWLEKLNNHIRHSQFNYFASLGKQILNKLDVETYSFMNMPIFNDLLNKLCIEYKIIEYYLASSPGGYFMLSDSQQLRLIVVNSEEMNALNNDQYQFIVPYNKLENSDYYYALIEETASKMSCYGDYIKILDQSLFDTHQSGLP